MTRLWSLAKKIYVLISPKSVVRFVSRNVLVDAHRAKLEKFRTSRDAPLPTDKEVIGTVSEPVDLATYEGKYPKSLFNKGVRRG